jgi:dihydrofolate synthase/folylpolyglutamate synthase
MRPAISQDYLASLNSTRIRLGLDRMRRLLGKLHDPQIKYETVVIGGTNGKGSIAAMTASILSAGGFRTGLYTSPHLIDVRERIRIDGRMISTEDMKAEIEEVRTQVTEEVTYFEFLTAVTFLHFDRRKVDLAILEVGMGGRLDATNLASPAVCVISNIGMDHQTYLGSRLEDIAREKIGIVKPGVPCVTAVRQSHLVRLFEEVCFRRRARLYRLGKDFSIRNKGNGFFSFKGTHRSHELLFCPLTGRHQLDNAALAVETVALLSEKGYRIEADAIFQGLKDTRWEGRLEILQERPLVLIDAAHNPAGIVALCNTLKTQFTGKRLVVIFGVLEDKDCRNMLKKLCPIAQRLIITKPDSGRAMPPEEVAKVAAPYCGNVAIAETPLAALHRALAEACPDDLICITGSIYLIGEIKNAYRKIH